jgi:hypothetical protein
MLAVGGVECWSKPSFSELADGGVAELDEGGGADDWLESDDGGTSRALGWSGILFVATYISVVGVWTISSLASMALRRQTSLTGGRTMAGVNLRQYFT